MPNLQPKLEIGIDHISSQSWWFTWEIVSPCRVMLIYHPVLRIELSSLRRVYKDIFWPIGPVISSSISIDEMEGSVCIFMSSINEPYDGGGHFFADWSKFHTILNLNFFSRGPLGTGGTSVHGLILTIQQSFDSWLMYHALTVGHITYPTWDSKWYHMSCENFALRDRDQVVSVDLTDKVISAGGILRLTCHLIFFRYEVRFYAC